MQKKKSRFIRMSDIPSEQVQWLWYPYIPCGKVTIIQGDPGEGKTSFVLAMIALLTPTANRCRRKKQLVRLSTSSTSRRRTGWRIPSSPGWSDRVRTVPVYW